MVALLFVVVVSYGQSRTAIRIGSDDVVSERGRNERPLRSRTYISKDIFGNTIIKDENDRTIKSIEKDIFGNTIIKDGSGHKLKSFEKDIFGYTQIKDGNGRTLQSIEKDIFGNTVVKDDRRNTILTIGESVFGAFTIKDGDGHVLFSYSKDTKSSKLVLWEETGRNDAIELVLFLTFDSKTSDVLMIEQSPYYMY